MYFFYSLLFNTNYIQCIVLECNKKVGCYTNNSVKYVKKKQKCTVKNINSSLYSL